MLEACPGGWLAGRASHWRNSLTFGLNDRIEGVRRRRPRRPRRNRHWLFLRSSIVGQMLSDIMNEEFIPNLYQHRQHRKGTCRPCGQQEQEEESQPLLQVATTTHTNLSCLERPRKLRLLKDYNHDKNDDCDEITSHISGRQRTINLSDIPITLSSNAPTSPL